MHDGSTMGVRSFGRVNWLGTWTLAKREVKRFWNVKSQTLGAPLITAGLFLLVFSIAIGPTRGEVLGVSYTTFIAPGLMAMTVIQNAFANTSSSISSAKVQGNIVDTLMPPLSPAEMVVGYVVGGVARGVLVALVLGIGIWAYLGVTPANPLIMLCFALLGSVFMAGLGMLAGIYAQKFDQLSAITNFVITPLAFLSGTFYSITALPAALEAACRWNPIFYAIDGVRFGMLGVSDASPMLGLAVCAVSSVLVCMAAWLWLKRGYRLKA